MSKKTMKILMALVLAVVALSSVSMVFAADGLIDYSPSPVEGDASKKVGDVLDNILAIVQVVGIGLAVIMLIVLAIKYISSAPNDKAEIKKHAVVYVVGAILLFASAGVIGLLRSFADLLK